MDKSKLILIVGAVLVVVSLGVSVFAVLTMSSAIKKIGTTTEAAATDETAGEVPISDISEFNLEENMIFQFHPAEDPEKTFTVVLEVGLGVNNKSKDYVVLGEELTTKQNILRDRLFKFMGTKKKEDFTTSEGVANLQTEALDLVRTLFETEDIVEVYFKNIITQEK